MCHPMTQSPSLGILPLVSWLYSSKKLVLSVGNNKMLDHSGMVESSNKSTGGLLLPCELPDFSMRSKPPPFLD